MFNSHLYTQAKLNEKFLMAINEKNIEKFKLLVNKHHLNPSLESNKLINYCYSNNLVDYAEELSKDKRVDLIGSDGRGLVDAATFGFIDVFKFIKSKHIHFSIFKNIFIYEAILSNHLELTKYLLDDFRVDPSEYKRFLIRDSIQNNVDYKIIKILMEDFRVYSNTNDIINSLAVANKMNKTKEVLLMFSIKSIQGNIKQANPFLYESLYKKYIQSKLKDF